MLELMKWKEMSSTLKQLKLDEADLRRAIAKEVVGEEPMVNGRLTIRRAVDEIPVKVVQTLNYRLDKSVLGTIWDKLSKEERACIKLEPKIKEGPFKKLPDDSLLMEAVTTTLAMPTIEVGEKS